MKPNDLVIGGKLSATVLQELLDQIATAGVKVRGGDGSTTIEQLRQALDKDGHLLLAVDQDKQLDGLADFCVRHGISFDRRRGEETVCFRSGMKRPTSPDAGGEALYDHDNIRPIAKELATLLTIKVSKAKLTAATVRVIRRLHGLLPPEIEPLPPAIIEET